MKLTASKKIIFAAQNLVDMNLKTKGYLLGAIAAATYGMNPLFALPLYKSGMDADSVLFFRYLFAIPIIGSMIKFRGREFKLKCNEVVPLVLMGVLMAVSSLALFMSYNYMSAGIASTILFVYPLLVALIMTFVFKEQLTFMTGFCILLTIGGIALLYKTEDGATLSLTGTLLVFLSSLLYAIYIVSVNSKRLKNIPTLKITFYALVFGMFIFFVRLRCGQDVIFPDRWYLWGNILALAIFPTAISFLCTTEAIQYIGSTPTAILGALEPVTAMFFSITIFGEAITIREGCGFCLIIVAVSLVVAGKNVTPYLVRFRKMFPKLHITK